MSTDSTLPDGTVLKDSRELAAVARVPEIDGYQILHEVSRGGQGIIYQAIQKSTKRKVAIKILLDGGFASWPGSKRFAREVELAAALKHANIVSIFDSGTTCDNRHFYAMDYIRGTPITAYVAGHRKTVNEALELFAHVCDAISHAHQRGIIHRDLKPSNILVDAEGVPHVLDFGLAKALTDPADTLVSQTGQLLGTLQYMSPEQTRGNPDEIDTRSDVYSLGVVLYEILTGTFPYPVSAPVAAALMHITTTAPVSPRRSWSAERGIVSPGLRCPIGDELATIVLKTLNKDRERRYQSAGELARDIRRYLVGETIEAKRDSAMYVLRKTVQRYCGPVIATMTIVLITIVGLVISSVAWRRAAEDRDAAVRFGERARRAEQAAITARDEERKQRQRAQELLDLSQLQLHVNRLTLARSYARQHEFALARDSLQFLTPAGSPVLAWPESLTLDWRWAAWEFLRRSGEISVTDLNANLAAQDRMRPARENTGEARIDVAHQRIDTVANGKDRSFDLTNGRIVPAPETEGRDYPF